MAFPPGAMRVRWDSSQLCKFCHAGQLLNCATVALKWLEWDLGSWLLARDYIVLVVIWPKIPDQAPD